MGSSEEQVVRGAEGETGVEVDAGSRMQQHRRMGKSGYHVQAQSKKNRGVKSRLLRSMLSSWISSRTVKIVRAVVGREGFRTRIHRTRIIAIPSQH